MGIFAQMLAEGSLQVEEEEPKKPEVNVEPEVEVKAESKGIIYFPTAFKITWKTESAEFPVYDKTDSVDGEWVEESDFSNYDKAYYEMSKAFFNMWCSWLGIIIGYRVSGKIDDDFLNKSFKLFWKTDVQMMTEYCPLEDTYVGKEIDLVFVKSMGIIPPALNNYLPGYTGITNIFTKLRAKQEDNLNAVVGIPF